MAVRTWAVAEICEGVHEVLAIAFPDQLWVRGEIQGYRVAPGGHAYFDLVEPDAATSAPPKIPVTLFNRHRRGVEAVLRKVGDLRLADGVEVRIRGRVGYYPPQARVQLVMEAIDPRHTLGRLAADRELVLRRLRAEGLDVANARRPLPLVPLRVGLVTSDDSAAANDVMHQLRASGFGFDVVLADSRVQGADAVASLVAGLSAVEAAEVDVVLLVRGGGSRTDLVAFDAEAVARAVAAAGVPVVTGVGHEIDRAVTDEVAHRACPTPTAAAALVVERVRSYLDALDQSWAALAGRASARLSRADRGLGRGAARLRVATSGTVAAGLDRLAADERRLHADATRSVRRADTTLTRAGERTAVLARVHLRAEQTRLDAAADRLVAAPRRRLAGAAGRIDAHERVVRSAHPERVMARGFAIVEHDGCAVRSVDGLTVGGPAVIRLADGTADVAVEATRRLRPHHVSVGTDRRPPRPQEAT